MHATMAAIMDNRLPFKTLRNGSKIPAMGFGTYTLEEQPINWALKTGYRLLDTATLYQNEVDVGNAIKKSGIPRDEIYVVTKLWNTDHGRQHALKAMNESLKRLGLDYVDLYLMHSAMGGKTLETWDAMVEIKENGLARSIGVANFNKHHLKQLKQARPGNLPMVNQIEIHPFLAWDECVSFCKEEDIAIMAYSPLAQAGKLKDPTLLKLAKLYSRSPAQMMLKWSLQKGYICIPRSSNRERIAQNFDVFDFRISEGDMQILDGLDDHYISDWPGAMDSVWVP